MLIPTNHVIPIWICDSLSNYVVSTETVNTFKWYLDEFWSDQDVFYNYKADPCSIGNHIIIVISWYKILVFVLVNVVYNI